MSGERENDAMPANRFGRYELLEIIAQGGMGVLYLAKQTGAAGFSRTVALKLGLPHLSQNESFRRSFLNEAQLAARLEHPNVVSIHDFGEEDGTYFIAMEYLPGEDLASILKRTRSRERPIPLPVIGALIQQSAAGLHHAHELLGPNGEPENFIHRDVSPSNIVVTYHGVTKLLDFGIAKARTIETDTVDGAFKGKLLYCAPEQLSDGEVDRRSDVFSLGTILWELLTQRRLFASRSAAGIMDAVRRREIPPPSRFRPDVPPELDRIAIDALARAPGARFPTAQAFGAALDAHFERLGSRPGQREIGAWLEELFGAERAQRKKALHQGHRPQVDPAPTTASGPVETTPSMSGMQPVLRSGWSTDLPSPALTIAHPAPTPLSLDLAPAPVSRTFSEVPATAPRRLLIVGAGACLAVGLAVGALAHFAAGAAEPPQVAPTRTGFVELTTTPPGAAISVDGEPTGLVTPARVAGLPCDRSVEIELALKDYLPESRAVDACAAPHAVDVDLAVGVARVRFEGLRGRRLYLDGVLVDARDALRVTVGPHAVRVESGDGLEVQRDIVVRAGEQLVNLDEEP